MALLALADLEREGAPLGGALLESPFMDLRGTLDRLEVLARPAERLGLWRAGRIAGFDPDAVSPLQASRGLRTPVGLLAGDAEPITPLAGVQPIAANLPDLTVVPGAGHLEAGARVTGGWRPWALQRLRNWNLD